MKIGLCFDCRYSRTVPGGRSTFYLCERSFTDGRYPKYPPLPVAACPGYERRPPGPEGAVRPGEDAPDDKLTG